MKLRQLECLLCVVDAGFNISHAAVALKATQPAVAKQLRHLEEELGAELLLRQGGRPVALTEAGERAVHWARRALQCVDNIAAVAEEHQGHAGGTITLATSHAHATYILLDAIGAFSGSHPQIQIQVLQGAPSQVAELVRDGKAVVGVTHTPPVLPAEVVSMPFLTSARVVIAPEGHAVLDEPALTLAVLARYPLIVPHSSRPQGARIVRRFHEAGLGMQPVVQALDMDVIKTYVTAGLGVGIIPDFCFSSTADAGLAARPAGHLFEPAVSTILLRRQSYVPASVCDFLQAIHPLLDRARITSLVQGEDLA